MNQININAPNRLHGIWRATKIIAWLVICLVAVALAGAWFGGMYESSFSDTAIAATRAAETCGMSQRAFIALPPILQTELKDQCSMPPMAGP